MPYGAARGPACRPFLLFATKLKFKNDANGTKVRKDFSGKPFAGEVRSYNPPYYKIKYEDDDEEELDAAKDETDLIVCHVQCFSRLNFQ